MNARSDHAARKRFVTAHDRNFSVVAAAGAGKTRAVVERIVEVARRDLDAVSRVVVVTYTNNAAREFKRRVTAAILGNQKTAEAPRILAALDRAFFGTIHSFCLSLLGDHQIELGLPSRLQTITKPEGYRLWEAFLNHPEVDDLIRRHPLTPKLLRFTSLAELVAIAGRMDHFEPYNEPGDPPTGLNVGPLADVKVKKGSDARDRLLEELRRYDRALRSLEPFVGLPGVAPTTDGLKAGCAAVLEPLLTWLEDAAYHWAGSLVQLYCRQRHRDGLLTFEDQIGLTVVLLQRPAVLDQIRRRGFSVILDEAQDTDRRMFGLLLEICRPPGAPWGTWPGSGPAPRPGAFVMVGDPRQTIYDRAGVKSYRAINESFRAGQGGDLLEFSVTHRCSIRVVATINQLFRGLQEAGTSLDDLTPSADAAAGGVIVLPLQKSSVEKPKVEELCREECTQLAAWLQQQGRTGLGVQSWSQVALLAPRHDWLDTCSAALKEQGIAHELFRPRTAWRAQPGYTWPLALVYSALHPWDRFERIGVLREIFTASDPVLARWAADGSTNDDPALHEGLECMARLERVLWADPGPSLAEFVHEVCREAKLRERLAVLGDPASTLDHFVERAYQATNDGVSAFAWVQSLLDVLDEETPGRSRPADALELVTIHSAKGLEWDVVIPLGLGRPVTVSNSTSYPRVVDTETWSGVAWNHLSSRCALGRRQQGDEERRRLLYVCLTRARRSLVLPYAPGFYVKGENSLASVAAQTPDAVESSDRLPPDASTGQSELPLNVLHFDRSKVAVAAELSHRYPQLTRPHALADDTERSERFLTDADGVYGFGRWWHGWVENFPWLAPRREQEKYCEAIPPDLSFGARAAAETARFLQSDAFRLLIEQGIRFRAEAPFSFCEGPAEWMEGVIDLLVQTRSGESWILDWKTNQPVPGEDPHAFLGHLRAKYLPQLTAYQNALAVGFGIPAARLLIYSTPLGLLA
ncbi:MAG TPA: UvrD-helicase domain-containing protein [Chthoniobacterales bacterium]